MWSYEAVWLIERLPHYWKVDLMAKPPRVLSAVHARSVARAEEAAEEKVIPLADLAKLGMTVKEV